MMAWTDSVESVNDTAQGLYVKYKFVRDGTGTVRYSEFRYNNAAQRTAEESARIANKKTKLELKYSVLNGFSQLYINNPDLASELEEIIRAGIVAIRNSPAVTFEAAQTWYDTNYPDATFKASKFFDTARAWLRQELGYVPTWDQFKTYVINHQFVGVDG